MSNLAMMMSLGSVGDLGYRSWDLSYAYYDPPEDLAWDVTTAYYDSILYNVSAEETNPRDLFFKPDGTQMYIIGSGGDVVDQYSLSTPWLVTTASYSQTSPYIGSQDSEGEGLFFKPDGTKMYIVGLNSDNVHEYDLSTAWEISTASYLQSFSVAAQETNPMAIHFKPDGTKMYILGDSGNDVTEYTLSTAWDISTASYTTAKSVGAQQSAPMGLFFKADGTRMYIVGQSALGGTNDVDQYELSTPWLLSTASALPLYSVNYINSVDPTGIFFHPNGEYLYMTDADGTNRGVHQLSLGGFNVADRELTPEALTFSSDGTKMYVIGTSGDDVNEYTLSTAWDTSTAVYSAVFNSGSQESVPKGITFKPDGTKMYVTGQTGDDVNEYNLSTAWSVVTASYVQNFSVASQTGSPQSVAFKPDGTKMYVAAADTDKMYEYSLSSPWDVSTASYTSEFDTSATASAITGAAFKSDGTKMFVVSSGDRVVEEYDLSTAWDITSASYSKEFYVGSVDLNPKDIFFRPDGMQFFIVCPNSDKVHTYSIGA